MAKSRDRRNRVDHTRQTATIRLFEDRDREQRDIIAEVGRTTPQNEAWGNSLLSSYTSQLFVISPAAERNTPIPPNAPIKLKKPFPKEGLKPKKLHFTDKETNEMEDEKRRSPKRTNLISIKMSTRKADFSKREGSESIERLDRENLSNMFRNIRLELDKENMRYEQEQYDRRARNNRPVAKERARSSNNSSQSSKLNYDPKDFNEFPMTLTPCEDTWSKEEKLLWLQPRRDVGIWIECSRKNCKKWRYCNDFHDPVDVPAIWYCKMNSNKRIASCFVPEQSKTSELEEDLIENKYNAGSLVWAHINGYPWWPAIVDDCPKTLRFYELKGQSIIPAKYHVTFFEDNIQHAWLHHKSIKAFIKCKKNTLMEKNRFYNVKYKEPLEKAYILAQSAIPLSIFERLQRFSYISRLRNMQESAVIQSYEEQDYEIDDIDEIPPTPILRSSKYVTLKEFYLKNKSYRKDEAFIK